jgi:hypothetical protein
MVVTGLIGGLTALMLTSPRGGAGPTILQAQSPAIAMAAAAGCVVLCTIVGIVIARLTNSIVGLFMVGWGLGILCLSTRTIQELAFTNGARPGLLPVETGLWAVMIFLAALAVLRFSPPLRDFQHRDYREQPGIFSSVSWLCAMAGLIVVPAVWLIAQSPLKGQVLLSVFLGAVAAGLVGRLMLPHAQPLLISVAPCVFGMLAQAAAVVMLRQPLDEALVQQTISHFLLPVPMDYAAGSLTGCAIGLGWARSFLHEEHGEHAPAAAPPARSRMA